jgi:cytochrome c
MIKRDVRQWQRGAVFLAVLAIAVGCSMNGAAQTAQPTPSSAPAADAVPGSVAAGAALYTSKSCVGCHGVNLEGGTAPKLVGEDSITGFTSTAQLFDYVRRSMPQTAPGTLTDDEVYSLIAFMLDKNGLNKDHKLVNARTLPTLSLKP